MFEFIPSPGELFSRISEVVTAVANSGSGMDLLLKAVVAYLIVVWMAFVIWVVRDITNRSESLIIQTFSILLIVVFTPVFGLPIYLLIRPRSTIFERYYEEYGLAESDGGEMASECDRCGTEVSEEYRYCPRCRNELLTPCPRCRKPIPKDWEHCAYCGVNVEEAEKLREKPKPKPKAEKKKEPPKESDRGEEGSETPKPKTVSIEDIPEILTKP